ncbi:MAG: hypothetical protein ING00_17620 [Roseomonas sp.]|nr:hypothetical protein [Roseomonas sp.]
MNLRISRDGIERDMTEAEAAEFLASLPEEQPTAPLPPVSGLRFKAALAIMGFISEAELTSPELPAIVQPLLEGMTAQQRIIARATWSELSEVRGDEELLMVFAAAHQPPLGRADIDQIMAVARAIP